MKLIHSKKYAVQNPELNPPLSTQPYKKGHSSSICQGKRHNSRYVGYKTPSLQPYIKVKLKVEDEGRWVSNLFIKLPMIESTYLNMRLRFPFYQQAPHGAPVNMLEILGARR